MYVTTSSTVWLAWRGTSNDWNAPSVPPRQTRTVNVLSLDISERKIAQLHLPLANAAIAPHRRIG